MKRTNVLVFWLGLSVTLAVVGMHWLGALTRWERLSIDFRFDAVPRNAAPMTDDIVHIDIDDGAFEAVGRWPWDRSKMADVINELKAAGVRTIALDLLLSDEQQHPEGSAPTIDHDGLFADAISRAECVLAVDVKTQPEFDRIWESERGREEYNALLGALGANIEIEDELAQEQAGLTGQRKTFFLGHPTRLRKAAAARVLRQASETPETLEEFERLIAPMKTARQGDYPQKRVLESVLQQAKAWDLVRPYLRPGDDDSDSPDKLTWFEDTAPLPRFAAAAKGFGFVNASTQTHPDGVVREMTILMSAPGGQAMQFGLIAAMHHAGLDPSTLEIGDDTIRMGDVQLPIRDGKKLWIAWPALSPYGKWLDGLGMDDPSALTDGRMPIAQLVDLAKARRGYAEQIAKLEGVSFTVQNGRRGLSVREQTTDPLSAESRDIVRDYVSIEFGIEDAASIDEMAVEYTNWVTGAPGLREEERRSKLAGLENAVRWTPLDARLGDDDATTLDRPTRDEFARLTLELLVPDQLEAFSADRTEEYIAFAQGESDRFLAEAPRADEAPAAKDHRANCELWRTTYKFCDEYAEAIRSSSAKIAAKVEDRLAFVGWTGTGVAADFVLTAQDPRTPGVNVHSAIAHMALTGDAMEFVPPFMEPLLILLVGLLCTFAAVRFSTLPSTLVALVILVAYLGIAGIWMFALQNYVMPLVGPISAGASSWIAVTALQAALVQRDRQRIEKQFKARVSTQLVDHLVTNPEAITVTGEEREMTTVFADLAGFTTVAETLGGAATVSTLNRYMCRLTDVLIDQGAYVNKFLGDGVMAFWSAFALDKEQATRGCIAALKCQQAVAEINADPGFENIPKIGMRVGVATGNVVVGDCGAPPALNDYTVIGDAVNLAARLESANKQFGTGILINGRTQELLEKSAPLKLRKMGNVIVVGQNTVVPIFEVLSLDASDELIDLTDRAVTAYGAGEFDECKALLKELEEKHGQEKFAKLYREAIDVVGEEFDGALHLVSK